MKHPDFLASCQLLLGDHAKDQGYFHGVDQPKTCRVCAMEAINFAISGEITDDVPVGYVGMLAILPTLNDGFGEEDDLRTETMRPYLSRLAKLNGESYEDITIACKVATYIVKVFLPEVLNEIGLDDRAKYFAAYKDVSTDNMGPLSIELSGLRLCDELNDLAARILDPSVGEQALRTVTRCVNMMKALVFANCTTGDRFDCQSEFQEVARCAGGAVSGRLDEDAVYARRVKAILDILTDGVA